MTLMESIWLLVAALWGALIGAVLLFWWMHTSLDRFRKENGK